MPSLFSIPEAIELGKSVLAAYDAFQNNSAPSLPAGYTLETELYADDLTDNLPDYVRFGFIARSGSDVVVAIRGTEGFLEWITDFEFLRTSFPYVPNAGETEHGFNDLYESLRTGPAADQPRAIDKIKGLVGDGSVKTLRISGHSLGAAIATMLAIEVAGNNVFSTPTVYTFASPRVGDKVFAGTYDTFVQTSWRISNLNDIVTQFPPQLAGYQHVDADYPINSDDMTVHSLTCWHSLDTYLHVLDASNVLLPTCVPK